MVDVATLEVKGDSSGLKPAEADLKSLEKQAGKTEVATKRLPSAMAGASSATDKFAKKTKIAGLNTANLAAQGNDVVVMALAMQNPLQLALQQGTQVSQVLNTMGGRQEIIRGLGAAFMSMINPVSLATIAILAGSTALVQWAFSASEADKEAVEFADRLEQVRVRMAELQDEVERLRLNVSPEEKTILDEMARIQSLINSYKQQYNDMGSVAKRNARLEIASLERKLQAERERLAELRMLQSEAEKLRKENERGGKAAERLKEALESISIDGLLVQVGILGIRLNSAAQTAYRMAKQAQQEFETNLDPFGGPGEFKYGVADTYTPENFGKTTRRNIGGGRRSGGGGVSQADREMQEMLRQRDRILEGLKSAQDKYNDSVAQADRLMKAGVLSQADYNRHLDQLGDELFEAKFSNLISGIESFSDSIADAIVNAGDLGDVFEQTIRQMAASIISSGIRNLITGLFKGGGGGGGGFFGKLFAGFFDGGGNIPAGQFGIAGEYGPEIVRGPAVVTSRADTAKMMQGGSGPVEVIVRHEPGMLVEVARGEATKVVERATPGIRAGATSDTLSYMQQTRDGWA